MDFSAALFSVVRIVTAKQLRRSYEKQLVIWRVRSTEQYEMRFINPRIVRTLAPLLRAGPIEVLGFAGRLKWP